MNRKSRDSFAAPFSFVTAFASMRVKPAQSAFLRMRLRPVFSPLLRWPAIFALFLAGLFLLGCPLQPAPAQTNAQSPVLRAGFSEIDITPAVGKDHSPVYLAGFGHNRLATKVHDPIMVRAVVLQSGDKKIALAAVDLVGLFLPSVERIRRQLPGLTYVCVSSTHNHEGPDTLGLWGPNFFQTGVDPQYLKQVEAGVVKAVTQADKDARPVKVRIGKARDPHLLNDKREPYVKHDELVALQFDGETSPGVRSTSPRGLIVQWNCHPETLASKNTEVSADFVAGTVALLKERYKCPVVYLSGTVGGLMTSLGVEVKDAAGRPLADGTFAKADAYGRLVGKLAEDALSKSQPLTLTPLSVRRKDVYLPIDNRLYVLGWQLGLLDRQAFLWKNEYEPGEALKDKKLPGQRVAMRTELAWLRLGALDVAIIPGEIYPELVLSKVQDPVDPGADFPDAPIEPGIYAQLKGPHRMIIGLGNDEIGYIIPKRQWDEKPPYCYGRKSAQYGEANSLGPDTAPILCKALQELVK